MTAVFKPVIEFVERFNNGVPAGITVKSVALVAVSCPATSTVILPVVVPAGTVAVIWVPAKFTELAAAMPLNLTPGVAPKLKPLIVTVSPTKPEAGEKAVIEGAVLPGVDVTKTSSMLILGRLPVEPPVPLL